MKHEKNELITKSIVWRKVKLCRDIVTLILSQKIIHKFQFHLESAKSQDSGEDVRSVLEFIIDRREDG